MEKKTHPGEALSAYYYLGSLTKFDLEDNKVVAVKIAGTKLVAKLVIAASNFSKIAAIVEAVPFVDSNLVEEDSQVEAKSLVDQDFKQVVQQFEHSTA